MSDKTFNTEHGPNQPDSTSASDTINKNNSTGRLGTKARSERRRSRKRVWLYAISGLLLAGIAAAGIGYYEVRPQQHFKHNNIPVLATPTNGSSAVPHDGEFNVLLLGIDARAKDQASRTDSIMIVHVNLNKRDYEAISIPRDTMVYLPGYGNTKITHANYMGELKGGLSQGTKDAIQAISNLTGLQINYYAETDYWGLQDIVDTLGGITVDVPFDVKLTHPWYPEDNGKVIKKGEQFLDGKMVTELVHERYSLPNGEFDRQRLQEVVLMGIAKEVFKPANIPHIPQVIHEMSKYLVTTNLSQEDMLSLGLGVKGFQPDQVHYYQVPGHAAMEMDPIVKQKLYYWIADKDKLSSIIQEHFLN
ncbi:LCP family protein [Alicyclobacillus pomorum]|uniref:LCP family protein n=1 Tax=Alicyclobacillus pomorum TaxID=204470 RepID=UPI000402EEDC|nr:LCP family protein [Alicyclobacillus pomorum]